MESTVKNEGEKQVHHEHSDPVSNRQEKIKNWLKDPYNLALVGIIVFAFAIRLYYFILTKGQTLWWDEAEYMATAKQWAFSVPYNLNPQRPPLFQFLEALSLMAGFGENFIKFFLSVVPSLLLVYAIYLLGTEMYNKKIGLAAAILASVSWTFVFWSARVQPDFFSMLFQVLSIFFMWKYWKNPQVKLIVFSGVFAALGFYFKISALLVPMIFGIFILIKDRFSAFKNKDYYYFAAAFLIALLPYFIWSSITFGNPFAFRQGYVDAPTDFAIGWYNLNFYYLLTENLLFVLFIIGVIIGAKFLLYSDMLLKEKRRCFDADLFSILALVFISVFYIFYMRNTDDRWVFLWMPFIFFLAANAVLAIFNILKKYNRLVAVVSIIVILLSCVYLQLNHADALIKMKKDSYLPVKLAGEWIKENYPKETKVLSISYTQTVAYSERNVTTYSHIRNSTAFEDYLSKTSPQLMMVSVFEPHLPWIGEWLQDNQNRTKAVQVYYGDAQKQQPILIVYELKNKI